MKFTKKIFAAALCFAFLAAMLAVFTVTAADITAAPTASQVTVNGEDTVFDAYNINGNNYFKLRDIAFKLNGTEKQFEVSYDEEQNAISLASGKAYTEVGGEMSGKGAENKPAVPTTSKIYLDGEEISLTAYNIDGNNYFKLRDIGQAFDFGVDYDSAKNIIMIDTGKPYTPESGTVQQPWTEKSIVINPGSEYELPGILTVPDGEGPFPTVIFVHGSGANDRDETVGKIKVFKDLAQQLASLGIASVRYDKRTYIYGQKIVNEADVNYTVKDETIDDAVSAAEFALQNADANKIDKEKIYVVGHSMGGYLIPRIYQADVKKVIAGYISLAGSARSMGDLMLEQIDYLLDLEKNMTASAKALYKKQIQDALQSISNLTEADRGKKILLLGNTYPTYWLDLANYNPSEEAKKVDKPMLFLQGGTDYQVTETDFNLWKVAVGERKDVKFILYPNLTHAFTYTENKSTPADYEIYATVDKQVSQDIADFVKS